MCGNFLSAPKLKSAQKRNTTKATVVIFEEHLKSNKSVCVFVCVAIATTPLPLVAFFQFQPAMHAQREA